jgi:hypothetical protein
MTRAEIRRRLRALFGLPTSATAGDHRERKRARLEAESRAWQRACAAEAAERQKYAMEREEEFRARLEQRGAIFPGDW